jgi:SAM-dependent methyltransferase
VGRTAGTSGPATARVVTAGCSGRAPSSSQVLPRERNALTDFQTLYGPEQSRFARYLERREQRRPDPVARELRRKALAGLRGRVIEVGSGDGRSFEHYPPEVERLLAVEPDPTARAAAAERARAAAFPINIVAGVAEALPTEDGSFDAAVVMGLLCSVPDPAAALRELRRVLAPGGELRFWEHVRSRNPAFRLLQRSFDALFWTRALGGCRTTRDTESAIRAAGFDIQALDRGFHSSSLATITTAPYLVGTAAAP